MSELFEKIEKMCKNRGISITKMCLESGASRGSLTDLKMGRSAELTIETLSKIAAYFGISVSDILGDTKEAPAPSGDELAAYLEDLRERPETRTLLEASRGMTKEQVEQMAAFAKSLRGGC